MNLYLANADGSNIERLTTSRTIDFAPKWSPDGTRIVYQSKTDNKSPNNIFMINSDGTNLQQLTDSSFDEAWPQWSSSGKQIMYVGQGLFVMSADGSDIQIVSDSIPVNVPAWSPDGIWLVGHKGTSHYIDVYLTDLTGNYLIKLTDAFRADRNVIWVPD
jgi:TolB protein